MGYEAHAVGVEHSERRAALCREATELLFRAHAAVGGEVLSAGGTGMYACNAWSNEIQGDRMR
jgi:D-threonine aldolase